MGEHTTTIEVDDEINISSKMTVVCNDNKQSLKDAKQQDAKQQDAKQQDAKQQDAKQPDAKQPITTETPGTTDAMKKNIDISHTYTPQSGSSQKR